jgi:hypothetical protein
MSDAPHEQSPEHTPSEEPGEGAETDEREDAEDRAGETPPGRGDTPPEPAD